MSSTLIDWEALRASAAEAATRAYAPYTDTRIGAAGLIDDGQVVVGCNVENAAAGVGLCAECGVVSASHTASSGRLIAVAVCDESGLDVPTCGRCRQLLHEVAGPDLPVNETRVGDLLPGAFGPGDRA